MQKRAKLDPSVQQALAEEDFAPGAEQVPAYGNRPLRNGDRR